jgi:gluconokinase
VQEPLHYLFLTAERSVIAKRLQARARHYMKAGMLESQLATLEAPSDAITIDADRPLQEVCAEVANHIRRLRTG